MPENRKDADRVLIRHRGRGAQVWICLGRLLRMFVYQNDWKVLPMAALIAGLVSMVIRRRFFIDMEGTLMGAFAMTCVAIWNGCFNSIQVICRERDVIKREHRSGMHISSYIVSHMMYQALLCLAQTGVTLYVTHIAGVKYPAEGLITPWFLADFGISMFLITYAADMLSLWVSALAHNTTTAMTIMPFVLIFQLVFSGGMLSLPAWTEPLTQFTVSNPGLKAIAAQADTNNRPFVTISGMMARMSGTEITFDLTPGQVLTILTDAENPTVRTLRDTEIGRTMTVGELKDALYASATFAAHRDDVLMEGMTLGSLAEFLDAIGIWDSLGDQVLLNSQITVGEIIDWVANNPDVRAHYDDRYSFSTTVGELLDLVGQEKVKTFLERKAAEASYKEEYALTEENVIGYWLHLLMFILAFAALAMITLEFIDRDKR